MELLRKIAALGEPRAAPDLLAAAIFHDLPAEETARLLEPLVMALQPEDVARADRAQTFWSAATLAPWTKLVGFRDLPGGWAIFAVASLSRDGHTRERAVRLLAELRTDGVELPYLMLRSSDHVPQVRQPANAALDERLARLGPTPFVRLLPLLHTLAGRRHGTLWLARVEALLELPANSAALEAGLLSRDPAVKRKCFDIALRTARRTEALQRMLRDGDGMLRLHALRLVAREQAFHAEVVAAARDAFLPVRRAALALLGGDEAEREWTHALLAPAASLRVDARRKLGERVDARKVYLAAIAERRELASAVAGLSETGQPDDAAELVLLTDDPHAKVREALAAAIARLLGAEAVDALIAMLVDPSRRVRATAAHALKKHLTAPVAERVWATARNDEALSLLATLPKWDALDYLLRARSVKHVEGWVRSSSAPLDRARALQLRGRLDGLPAQLRRMLEFELDFWIKQPERASETPAGG